jgi:4-aminobutyrate aminotransferase
MATENPTAAQKIEELRRRYVTNAVSTPPIVIDRVSGPARIVDADGTEFIDFAGGLGCLNFGQQAPAIVAAIQQQAERYLHQCFMVAMYEPYVDVCRRLAELSPCQGDEQKSLLLSTGAEGVENAVKIARAKTGRPAVIAFDRAFHGRTLMALTLTSKVVPYKQGFGPYAPEVYRAPAPYPYRGVTSDDAIRALETLFMTDVDPEEVACVVLEPVQGEGGFIPMPPDFPARLKEICEHHGILYVDDEVQAGMGRTGPVWAIEHYGVQPDLLVSGKSLGGGLPLAAVTGPAAIMDSVPAGGLGGTFGGNPLSCAAAAVALDTVADPAFRERARRLGEDMRNRLEDIASSHAFVGEVRGLGPMLALELVGDPATREPARELALATTVAARDRGLILLSCGLYGNVIRILVPEVIDDDDLREGLDRLESALEDAAGRLGVAA